MLDAAHGEAVRAGIVIERVHSSGVENQVAGIAIPRGERRGGPADTCTADIGQGSRRVGAVARSRHMKQSLE